MLQQYLELKQAHQDALLLYRLGDFYELFFEDAEVAAPILGVVLTRRRHNDQVTSPMCGIPHHALAGYMGKLLEHDLRVAIAEQVEDAAKAGGLVRREVVRVLTPGTVTDPELLGEGERRWVAAVTGQGDRWAVAFVEPASGELWGAGCTARSEVAELLHGMAPRELLVAEERSEREALLPPGVKGPLFTTVPGVSFDPGRGEEVIRRVLAVGSLRAFELEPGEPLVGATAALLSYLERTQGELPRHIRSFRRRRPGGELLLDAATVRNLELLRDASGGRDASLARILDHTATAMGSRLLRDWLVRPSGQPVVAAARHDAVAALVADPQALKELVASLKEIGDLERAAARIGLRQARPGELAGLRRSLALLPGLAARLQDSPSELLAGLGRDLDPLEDLLQELQKVLAEEPPALFGPGVIRSGCDEELDEARRLAFGAKEVLGELEARERAATGIGGLKVRFNRVFGYGLEVPRAHSSRVPENWIRRQTLTSAERFSNPELEELERRISGAEAAAAEREQTLFAALQLFAADRAARLAATARAVAAADVLAAFADRARRMHYVQPRLVAGPTVRLRGSRHPVVEAVSRSSFVPNDVEMDGEARQVILLTGPNMGGKSTFLRQVALAVVMARAGAFVAADEAEIGEIDRVFTRVGAADDLARGESTFMVEMTEVALILRHATPRSLVVLDEVGRGTATFDGLSIAWAVVEALHPDSDPGPLVLFATHYHELTDLARQLPRVANASVAVKEYRGQVLFLHRVVPGPSDRSYGIHVARLAGVPEEACRRAEELLTMLERKELRVVEAARPAGQPHQPSLFPPAEDVVVERLHRLDLDAITPLDALNLLAELKREVKG